MLFFEFFPALITIVSLIIGAWLYFSNRTAPDDSAQNARRQRERDERTAAALGQGHVGDVRPTRPSMRQ